MSWAEVRRGRRATLRCEAAWTFSTVGISAFTIVLALYSYYEHGPAGVAIAVGARMLPAAVVGRLRTRIWERWPWSRSIFLSAVLRFALIEAVAVLTSQESSFPLLLTLVGAIEVLNWLQRAAYPQQLLACAARSEDVGALGSIPTTTALGLLGGAALAAGCLAVVSQAATFAFAGLAFVAVAAVGRGAPAPAAHSSTAPADARGEGALPERSPGSPAAMRLRLALFAVAVLAESTLDLIFVVLALHLLRGDESTFASLRVAFAAGGVLSAGVSRRWLRTGRLAGAVIVGLLLFALALITVAAWPRTADVLVLLGFAGGGYILFESSLALLTPRLMTTDAVAAAAAVQAYGYPLIRAVGAGMGAWLVLAFGARTTLIVIAVLPAMLCLAAVRALRAAEHARAIPQKALAALRGVPVLAALPPAGLENLAIHARAATYARGTTIARPGGGEPNLYVIAAGSAVQRDGEPSRGAGVLLGPGSSFGESAVLGRRGPEAPVVAMTELSVWTVARGDLVACLGGPGREPEAPPGQREWLASPSGSAFSSLGPSEVDATKGAAMSDKNVDEGKGRVKEAAGSLTGDDSLKNEGKTDQAKSSVKDAVDGVVDKAGDVKDSVTGDH